MRWYDLIDLIVNSTCKRLSYYFIIQKVQMATRKFYDRTSGTFVTQEVFYQNISNPGISITNKPTTHLQTRYPNSSSSQYLFNKNQQTSNKLQAPSNPRQSFQYPKDLNLRKQENSLSYSPYGNSTRSYSPEIHNSLLLSSQKLLKQQSKTDSNTSTKEINQIYNRQETNNFQTNLPATQTNYLGGTYNQRQAKTFQKNGLAPQLSYNEAFKTQKPITEFTSQSKIPSREQVYKYQSSLANQLLKERSGTTSQKQHLLGQGGAYDIARQFGRNLDESPLSLDTGESLRNSQNKSEQVATKAFVSSTGFLNPSENQKKQAQREATLKSNLQGQTGQPSKKNAEKLKIQEDWKGKYEKASLDIKRLQKQNQFLKCNSTFSSYKTKIIQLETQVRGFNDQIQTMKSRCSKLEQEKDNYQREIQTLKQKDIQKPLYSNQVQLLNNKNVNLVSQLNQLKSQNAFLKDTQKSFQLFKQNQLNAEKENNKALSLQLQRIKNQLEKSAQQKNEIKRLKDILQLKENSYNTLIIENNALKNQVKDSVQKASYSQQKSETLTKKLEALKNELEYQRNTRVSKNNHLQQRLSGSRTQLNVISSNNAPSLNEKSLVLQLLTNNNQLLRLTEQLNRKITQDVSIYHTLQSQNNTLKSQLNALKQKRLAAQTESQSQLKQRNNQVILQNQSLRRNLQAQSDKQLRNGQYIRSIEQTLIKKDRDLDALQLQLSEKEQAIKRVNLEIFELRQLLQQKEVGLQDFSGRIRTLQTTITSYQSERQIQSSNRLQQLKVTQLNARLEAEIKQEREKVTLKQSQIRNLTEQNKILRAEKSSEMDKIKAELTKKQQAIKDLQSNSRNISSNSEQMRKKFDDLLKQYMKISQNYKQQANNLQQLSSELQTLKATKETQLNSLRSQVASRDSMINNLKKTSSITDQYKLLPQENKKLLQENKKLHKKIEQKEYYEKEMQQNIRSIENNYEELRKENESLEERKRQLQTQNDSLNEKYSQLLKEKHKSYISNSKIYSQQTRTLKEQNANLQSKLKQLEQKYRASVQSLKKEQAKQSVFSNDSKQLKQKYQELENKFCRVVNDLASTQQEKDKLQIQLNQLNQKLANSQSKELQSRKAAAAIQEVNRLREQNKRLALSNEGLQFSNSELQKRFNDLNQKCTELSLELNKITYLKSSKDSEEINRLSAQNFELKRTVEKLGKNIPNQKYGYNQLQFSPSKAKDDQFEAIIRDLSFYKERSQKLQSQLHQLQSRLAQLQKVNRDSLSNQRALQDTNRQIANLRSEKSQLESQLYRLKNNYAQLLENHQKMSRELKGSQPSTVGFKHLFHGDVLRDEDDHKLFIKQCIQSHQKIKILDTRLIYRYDPLSKQNIHKYIDQKPQLVVVIKLVNGYFLAGYCQGFFKPRTPSQKEGLIMSLTNKRCYYLVERNRRSISYDDFFVIFGNSEIRIKSQEKKVFSNFGVSNSYYRHNGDGVNVLLGGTKTEREIGVDGYEFYQLILKQ